MTPWWRRHPTLGKVVAFLLGVLLGAGGVAVLEYVTRPRCPSCGTRMRRDES
jgi:hypothetical protein